MPVTANAIAFGLDNTFKKILSNSRASYDVQLTESIEKFKTKIQTPVVENFKKLREAYTQHLKNQKQAETQIKRIMKDFDELRFGIFKEGFVKTIKDDSSLEIKINFKNTLGKDILKLYDFGSGTLGVPTTRIVFKVCQEMREELGGGIELIL